MSIDYAKLADPFAKSDWEWRAERVGITNGKPWCNVVPYIQNRAIQERLDMVCGPQNWKNQFIQWRDMSQLCGISIYDEQKNEWVTKWDGADNTQFQGTKGGLSASMKRAAVQWGIGRHLYEEKSVFVECSLEKKRGWEKASTKDKKDVWWNPNDTQLCGAPFNTPDEEPDEPAEFVAQLEAKKELEKKWVDAGYNPKQLAPSFKKRTGIDIDEAPASLIRKAIKDCKAKQKEAAK